MRNWKLALGVLCLVIVLLIGGCGKKSPSTKPTPEPEPGETGVQIFCETFDNFVDPTNVKENLSLLDNPDSLTPDSTYPQLISSEYLWAGREAGALSMDDGTTETEPGQNAPRVAFKVPELDKATKPVLKLTAKNISGNDIFLYVGNKFNASGSLGADGHRAHGVIEIKANSPYTVYSIELNESWLASNLIQLRPTIIDKEDKNTQTGAAGLVIDKIEIVAESTTAKLNYELTVNIVGEGTVNPDGGTFDAGSTVTLTATPNEGWVFNSWSGDIEGATIDGNKITFKMYGDKNITAEFVEEDKKYALNVNIEGNGDVNVDPPEGPYGVGTEVTLTAIPDEGWEFSKWTGAVESTEATIKVVMDSEKTVTAVFVEKIVLPVGDKEMVPVLEELQALTLPALYKGFLIGDGMSFDSSGNRKWDGVVYKVRIKPGGGGPTSSGKHRTIAFHAQAGQEVMILASPGSSGEGKKIAIAPYNDGSYGEPIYVSEDITDSSILYCITYTFDTDGEYAAYTIQNVNFHYIAVKTP